MSVIVMGMEMPKNCAECERWSICKCLNDYEDYESILYAVEDGDLVRNKNCPLIEVPTTHGRLADLDKMINDFWDCDSMIIGNYELEKIKTVIEAEE